MNVVKKLVRFAIIASIIGPTLASCQKEEFESRHNNYSDNPEPTPVNDMLKIKSSKNAFVSSETGIENITARFNGNVSLSALPYYIVLDQAAVKGLSIESYKNIIKAATDWHVVIFPNPDVNILKEFSDKFYSTLVDMIGNNEIKHDSGHVALIFSNQLDIIISSVKDWDADITPAAVAIKGNKIFLYFTKIMTEEGPIILNEYSKGLQADNFIEWGEAIEVNSNTFRAVDERIINIDSNPVVSQPIYVRYDCNKVGYEKDNICPTASGLITRNYFAAFAPEMTNGKRYSSGKGHDIYMVKQTVRINFSEFRVPNNKYGWQIGRRHYGPYLNKLRMSNRLSFKGNVLPNDVLVLDPKPTNGYKDMTYSQSSTLGISYGVSASENPSISMTASYSVTSGVSYSAKIVECTSLTNNSVPAFEYKRTVGDPQTHREMDYGVHHDVLNDDLFTNHEYQQCWYWRFSSNPTMSELEVSDDLTLDISMSDLCWDWTNWTHLKTEEHYNTLYFQYNNSMKFPKMRRSLQTWHISLTTDASSAEKAKIEKVLTDYIENYKTSFDLPTYTEDETKTIDYVIAQTKNSLNNSRIEFQDMGVTSSFTLKWKRADKEDVYMKYDFNPISK